jgi:hypothetical protein
VRTSGILTVGGGLVAFLGGLFTLFMLRFFFVDKGQGFVDLSGVVAGGVVFALGLAGIAAGRRRGKLERESDERSFAETTQAIARRQGGRVALDAVCKATGLPSDEAQTKMRTLTGKGLFDLDFDGNGQMIYKIAESPARLAPESLH